MGPENGRQNGRMSMPSSLLEARGRLRSISSSSSLIVRRTRLSTVGDRAFPVAAARVSNELRRHVTSAPSLIEFSEVVSRLIFLAVPFPQLSVCEVSRVIIGHFTRFCYVLTC